MQKSILLFLLLISTPLFSQNRGLSVKLGGDYCQTTMVTEQPFNTSIIGSFTSRNGFRIGLSYEQPIYKRFSLMTDMGYSLGGFDNYKHINAYKVHQAYLSIAPEIYIAKFFKIHAGGLLNLNFKSKKDLTRYMETFNYGFDIGAALMFNRFELGFHYTNYLNHYFDYKKLFPFAVDEKEYWNIKGIYIGYRFGGKNPLTLK